MDKVNLKEWIDKINNKLGVTVLSADFASEIRTMIDERGALVGAIYGILSVTTDDLNFYSFPIVDGSIIVEHKGSFITHTFIEYKHTSSILDENDVQYIDFKVITDDTKDSSCKLLRKKITVDIITP